MEAKPRELGKRLHGLMMLKRAMLYNTWAEQGLHWGQLPILEYVIRNEGCTQRKIADELRVTPASVALSTKRLQKAGLLTKYADQNNLRCNRLSVTPRGKTLAEDCRREFDKVDDVLFRDFSEPELCELKSYFDRMIGNMMKELKSRGEKGPDCPFPWQDKAAECGGENE